MRRILGVDPGLRTTGYGVIACENGRYTLVEGGVLQPSPNVPLEKRLAQLHAGMVDVVQTTKPDCMVVEELWTNYKNPTTAVLMGHARGVIALAAGTAGIPMHDLAHSLVKRALAGSGSAKKDQVGGMVVALLGLKKLPTPNDVTDALALAIAFANIEMQNERFADRGVRLPTRRSIPTQLAR